MIQQKLYITFFITAKQRFKFSLKLTKKWIGWFTTQACRMCPFYTTNDQKSVTG